MILIKNRNTTELLNTHKNSQLDRKQVTTELARVCLDEMRQTHLGWGYSIKKFLATNLAYTSVLLSPLFALTGALYLTFNPQLLVASGTVLGSVLAADFAIGKLLGIRPLTLCLLAVYDAHRHGAKTVAKMVENSYTAHEQEMKELRAKIRETLVQELKEAYLTIHPADAAALKTQLPLIEKALSQLGLHKFEVAAILSPLKNQLLFLAE